MIISMSDILCITNRKLCKGDFLNRIQEIAANHPAAIVLREKDLPEAEYKELASKVISICREHQTPCILHNYYETAAELGVKSVHLPLGVLRGMNEEQKAVFTEIGSSCHSVEDALEAVRLGCTYIMAGHIFDTDCKKGLPGRGLEFLREVCASVSIPGYGIGGIAAENEKSVLEAGAEGICIMSGMMQCEDVCSDFRKLEEALAI